MRTTPEKAFLGGERVDVVDDRHDRDATACVWQAPLRGSEAPLEQTEHGLVAGGDGWYVLNARASRWYYVTGRGAFCDLEGEQDFSQVGINVQVLEPGEAMAMYHWEADQEDFLVVAGDALLIIEGEERPLRQWDFVHCPPNAKHTIVGAGTGPASSSPSAPASTRTAPTGAATRSTRSPFATEPVSSRRRPSLTRRTPPSASVTGCVSRRGTATAGFLAQPRRDPGTAAASHAG